MNQFHPLSALACLATAGLICGLSFSAEPKAIDVPVIALPATPSADIAKEAAPAPPSVECPEYAQALSDSYSHRTLVVVTFTGCPACEAMKADLTNNSVPFSEVNRERHPRTFASFRASSYPTWYVFRNGKTVASGAKRVPASFLKQVLAEDAP